MNELRKSIYVLDMVVLAFFLFAINHSMFFEKWIVEVTLDLSILLRITVSLLLYKRERLVMFPLVVFTLFQVLASLVRVTTNQMI